MKIVSANALVIGGVDEKEMIKKIERCGRTCYKSEDKITPESSSVFIKNLLSRQHLSVLEHEILTVLFICDRGVSHEIVRHRLASFSQESTRYVNYQKKGIEFIRPCWFKTIPCGNYELNSKQQLKTDFNIDWQSINIEEKMWLNHMVESEVMYNNLITQGWTPQYARSVLPNSLKTEIAMTCNIREWRYILKLRTDKTCHPQMIEVMSILLNVLKTNIPTLFGDL